MRCSNLRKEYTEPKIIIKPLTFEDIVCSSQGEGTVDEQANQGGGAFWGDDGP